MKRYLVHVLLAALIGLGAYAGENDSLKMAVKADHRSEDNKARDKYRKPHEVLSWFGVKPDMTVVEIYPGGGWYTEILGPYLKDQGQLIAAVYDRNPETQAKWMAGANQRYADNCLSKPEVYGNIKAVDLVLPDKTELAPEGSVDMILDFRNAHNWVKWGEEAMVTSWFKALKKGGTVGLVDHRMDDDKEYNPRNGYVHQKQMVELMEKHGFKFAGSSDLLRNTADTKDHPKGVWTLPPSLALGEQDRDKYLKIGESDRLTLKFVKP